MLRRNVPALTPSQKENMIRKRASWSPAGLAGANVASGVGPEIVVKEDRRMLSEECVREKIKKSPLPNIPGGVDLLQFTPTSGAKGLDPPLNPFPDLLGSCEASSTFNFSSVAPDQSLKTPNTLPVGPFSSHLGSSVSAPPTPNYEVFPSSYATPSGGEGKHPPFLPKKVRFHSSPSYIHRQRSLLDLDMGEGSDVHNPLMEYNPVIQPSQAPATDAVLLDLNF